MTSIAELLTDDADDEHHHVGSVAHVLEAFAVLLEAIDHRPGEWADRAACKGQTEVMFPVRGSSAEPARALCRSCPVLDECAAWVLEVPNQHGIVADSSHRERMWQRGPSAA